MHLLWFFHHYCYLKQPITTFSSLIGRSTPFNSNTKEGTLQCILRDECQVFPEQCRCESLEESTASFSVLFCSQLSIFSWKTSFPSGINACRQRELIKGIKEEHSVGCLVLIPQTQHLNNWLWHIKQVS